MLWPFLWMVMTSFKPVSELVKYPGELLPHTWAFTNYPQAMQQAKFGLYFGNSVVISSLETLLRLTVCSIAGYSFARLRFPLRGLLFVLVLGTMMVPFQIVMIPLFIIVKSMPLAGGNDYLGAGGTGWLNSYQGIVVPWIANGFSIFFFRQFFKGLPAELEDAGRVDGASEFTIFSRIFLPLSGPVMAVLTVFTFQGSWNSFVWPLIMTTNEKVRPIQVGLAIFNQEYGARYEFLMAGTVVASLPLIVAFLLAQRYFVRGIALFGLK